MLEYHPRYGFGEALSDSPARGRGREERRPRHGRTETTDGPRSHDGFGQRSRGDGPVRDRDDRRSAHAGDRERGDAGPQAQAGSDERSRGDGPVRDSDHARDDRLHALTATAEGATPEGGARAR